MSIIDDFISKLEPQKIVQINRIRDIAKKVVPEAEDCLSYGMPALKYKGKSFFGLNAHKNHIGIYPFGAEEVEVYKAEIEDHGFSHTKGAIQVPYDKTFPEALLKKIIKHRIERI